MAFQSHLLCPLRSYRLVNPPYWQLTIHLLMRVTISSGGSRISPRRGCQLPKGGANIRFCQNFPKTAWNRKNLDPQVGGRASPAPPLDPPLISLVTCSKLRYYLMHRKWKLQQYVSMVTTPRRGCSDSVAQRLSNKVSYCNKVNSGLFCRYPDLA